MTEAEWKACNDLSRMFRHIRSPHDRKQRLAVIAILRVLAARFPGPKVERLLSAYETWADSGDRDRFAADLGGLSPWGDDLDHGDAVFRGSVRSGVRGFGNGGDCRVAEIRLAPDHKAHAAHLPYDGPDHRPAAVSVVRDIFGNPFKPVPVNPSWLTSTVVSLAARMYESRDFGAMPILADALQDAGCEDADVLNHCRDSEASHVRGCWVVDLLTGRS